MLDWPELKAQALACRGCSLAETRNHVVFGVGSETAEVLFLGEGPGEQEDLTGEPFVGRGGKLLDDMLGAIDLHRENIYIANMVKCRPPMNRNPLDVEQSACSGWLQNQIDLIKPKIIVCLGSVSARRIIDEKLKITQDHGKWYPKNGALMMALYHPAFLLRDPRRRPETFEDLKVLQGKIREICTRTYAS